MPNTYLSLDELKGQSAGMGLDISATGGDARLLGVLEAQSRLVDRWCNRQFFVSTGTKYFSGDASTVLVVNDLVSVTTLLQDDNWDGTFNLGWAATDYFLAPYNADPTSQDGSPYTRIEVNRFSNGSKSIFDRGPRNFSIEAQWGYVSVTTSVGNLSASLDGTATAVTFTGTNAGAYEAGWTIKVDGEQMYVRSESGTAVTVLRGVNGSTATVHASGTAISRYQYPEPIAMAVLIQTERIFKRSQGAFAAEIGNPITGDVITVRTGLDRDAQDLLIPYRRIAFGGIG